MADLELAKANLELVKSYKSEFEIVKHIFDVADSHKPVNTEHPDYDKKIALFEKYEQMGENYVNMLCDILTIEYDDMIALCFDYDNAIKYHSQF